MTAIRFTKQPSERSGGSEYEVGQVVDLKSESASRWVRRGVAVFVDDDAKAPVETAALKAPEQAMKPRPKPKVAKEAGD